MNWLVLSYSLPAGERSSPRVALWRRLNRLGALSVRSGVHILPARDDCAEAFNWLAREVRQQRGECLVMKVDSFEGLTDQELVNLFRKSTESAVKEMEESISSIDRQIKSKLSGEERTRLHGIIAKLRKKLNDIASTDFFESPACVQMTARLTELERRLFSDRVTVKPIAYLSIKSYQKKRWVTRARPHVDRLGCAWLIRRFIDRQAKIRFSNNPKPGELSFDMKEEGDFGHVGSFCTFETMLTAFNLKDRALWKIAEIVHEIDLRDSRYLHPEASGIDTILRGWLLHGFPDEELDVFGMALFDGLYADILRSEKSAKRSK